MISKYGIEFEFHKNLFQENIVYITENLDDLKQLKVGISLCIVDSPYNKIHCRDYKTFMITCFPYLDFKLRVKGLCI